MEGIVWRANLLRVFVGLTALISVVELVFGLGLAWNDASVPATHWTLTGLSSATHVAVVLWACWQINWLLIGYRAGAFFTEDAVNYLVRFGGALIVYGLLPHVALNGSGMRGGLQLSWDLVAVGLFITVLGLIQREGVRLREEQELVI